MIDMQRNPVEWAMLICGLDEAKEHIESLTQQMQAGEIIDEEDFKVQLFHIMTHLNRAWNSRSHTGEISHELFNDFSEHPKDFVTIG